MTCAVSHTCISAVSELDMAFEFLQTESKEVAVSDDHNKQVRLYDESYSLMENVLLQLVYSVFCRPQEEEKKPTEGSVH